MWHT
ncbi:hypothetical protein ECEC1735_2336, partial [Escherichia coli EC1735]